MLRPRTRKVLRDVWHHKARTALVVLAIAIGIIGAGAVLNTWALLKRVTHDGYLATNPASATIRTDSIDATLLEQVRAMPSIAQAEARRTVIGSALVEGSWRTTFLFAVQDFETLGIGKVQLEAGAWPPHDRSVVIERSSVEFGATGIAQPLTVRVGDGQERTLEVTGIVRDAGLAPGWMEHIVYSFVTPGTLDWLGVPSSMNQLLIVARDRSLDREGVRQVAYEVKALIERSGRPVTDVSVPEPGTHVHAAQINSLLYTQGAFGVLALLLSGFLVINLIGAMLAGQVREIGVMKAVGARGGQIAGMYLSLALVLGLVACLIALPVAAVIGRWYAGFTADLLNFDMRGFEIPLWAMAVQLGVGALLPVAAAAIPVTRGCLLPVSEALRHFGIDAPGGAPGRLLSRLGGPARPMLLSLRNAFRQRQRMALTLLTLALGGAVYLGALNLRFSIMRSVGHVFGELNRFDLAVQVARPVDADSLEAAIAALPGVTGVEGWARVRAAVSKPGGVMGNSFAITALPPGSRMVSYPVTAGRWLVPGDTAALVINQRLLSEEPSLAVGDSVSLVLGGRPSRWTIVGVVESGIELAGYVSREGFPTRTGNRGVSLAVITSASREEASQSALSRRLRADLTDQGWEIRSSQLVAESRRVLEDHLLLVAGFLMIMAQAMIVVGGLGLASTMSLSVLERTREIGVLKAIGARHRAILSIVQVEGLVVSLLSWVLAIPLSIPMSVVIGRAFGRIMMPLGMTTWLPDSAGVLLWLGVVVGVSLLACAWPAWRAIRVTTAAALAYE